VKKTGHTFSALSRFSDASTSPPGWSSPAAAARPGWVLGTTALAVAKSIENMELGHNICHGQWDWMNDPEIHSSTGEWDMAGVSSQWRYSHNYHHHVFTNVIGMDDDLGYGVLRVTRDQQWRLSNLLQPLRNMLLAIMFEWGIALQGLHSAHHRAATDAEKTAQTRGLDETNFSLRRHVVNTELVKCFEYRGQA
jgi:fatty acid desaturase